MLIFKRTNIIKEGTSKKHEFQAETKKILDIVVRSLYSDREVFVRELISNASDALEKVRHKIMSGKEVTDNTLPMEINVVADKEKKTLIIQDNGIGMTEDELVTNLGRIGHSGSAEFIKNIGNKDLNNSTSIIGQFGVGFYSAFMVANKITVYSKSAEPGSKGYCWSSDGSGSYEIVEADNVTRGTKIILELNTESGQFAEQEEIDTIIKKYSNFVGYPIKLNDKTVNTVKAIWTLSKDQITEKDHAEFFKFISHSYTDPLFHLHYTTDSPLSIRAIFYVGQQNQEKFGLGRSEIGVNLFSKKVLIQQKAKGLIPEWLRFVKGVVDSEDIPLNISREFLQDSTVIRRIKTVITRRILKWLDEESKKNKEKYDKFIDEFGPHLKEGICTDFGLKEDIAKLLRFESSALDKGQYTSLDDYISRMKPEQKQIYYLCAPSREAALTSPYYEGFKSTNEEVLFLYHPIDDFVMTNNLIEYKDKKLISAESNNVPIKSNDSNTTSLSNEDIQHLIKWMKEALEDKVANIKSTNRLVDSPAIVVGHDSSAHRRMMKYVDPQNTPSLSKQQLEINPNHPIMKKLFVASKTKPKLAQTIAEQILDNALIAAGLVDDARFMVTRMNTILSSALENPNDISTTTVEK